MTIRGIKLLAGCRIIYPNFPTFGRLVPMFFASPFLSSSAFIFFIGYFYLFLLYFANNIGCRLANCSPVIDATLFNIIPTFFLVLSITLNFVSMMAVGSCSCGTSRSKMIFIYQISYRSSRNFVVITNLNILY